MDTAPAMQLVLFREADLAAIPERRRLRVKIHFTDECEIARRPGEFASATGNVRGVGDDREKRLRKRSGCRHGRIEENRVSRFRDPMMLDMKHYRAACARLRRAQERCTDRAPEIPRCGAQGVGEWINRAEVGHAGATNGNAMTFRGT